MYCKALLIISVRADDVNLVLCGLQQHGFTKFAQLKESWNLGRASRKPTFLKTGGRLDHT